MLTNPIAHSTRRPAPAVTPTDLPTGTTVMVRCSCVYGTPADNRVRYTYAGCARHGYVEELNLAAAVLRERGAAAALRIIQAVSITRGPSGLSGGPR